MTNLRCEIEKELSMVAQRAGSEEVTNGRGDNTLINWNPSLEDKFVTKTRDQPEPGSFFPRSLWGGEMKDPGNEVDAVAPPKKSAPNLPEVDLDFLKARFS